tara:strand:+ start:643 stop:1023 length:381 start_codon:yes stop_codon:yes gene_type:complete
MENVNKELTAALDDLASRFENYTVSECPTPTGNDVIIINPEAEHFKEVQTIVEDLPKKHHEQFTSMYVTLAWSRPHKIIKAGPTCTRYSKDDLALSSETTKSLAKVILGGKYLVLPENAFTVKVNG